MFFSLFYFLIFVHSSALIPSWAELPTETQMKIFDYLPITDQYSVGATCRTLSLCYDTIVERNEIHKDKRDFKRFEYYLEKNFKHQEIIPDFQGTAFDFNVFTPLQFSRVLLAGWKSVACKLFVDSVIFYQLIAKTSNTKYTYLFSFSINILEILYKKLVRKQIKKNSTSSENFVKSIKKAQQSDTSLLNKIDPVVLLAMKLLSISFIPVLITDLSSNMVPSYSIYKGMFFYTSFFYTSFFCIEGFGRDSDNSNNGFFKADNFMILQNQSDNFSKTTRFYPYTVEGARFITTMKRINIILFILKAMSFLYTFYNFYLSCVDQKSIESLTLHRTKMVNILNKVIFNYQKYQKIKEILPSNVDYIFYYDRFLKFLLNL